MEDDPELAAIKARVKEMEEEAEKLKVMHSVEKGGGKKCEKMFDFHGNCSRDVSKWVLEVH